jgi:hypothetical protein
MDRTDLLGLTPDELDTALLHHFQARGQGAYRVRQTRPWLYRRDALSFRLPTAGPGRSALAEAFELCAPRRAGPAKHRRHGEAPVAHA